VLLAAAAAGCGSSSSGSSASGKPSGPAGSSSAPAGGTSGTTAPTTAGGGTTAGGAIGGTDATTAPSAGSAPAGTARPPASAAGTGPTRCTVTDLRLRLGRGDPGAGNIYYPLLFTNTSDHSCILNGYPGVSLLRGDGSAIGHPATRTGTKGTAVRLAPGQTVQADLHTLNQGLKGDSCWRTPTLLKVYPPGSTDAMTLATADPVVCGDTFDIGTVH
jgi:Protein of unknown function (DUF4232)